MKAEVNGDDAKVSYRRILKSSSILACSQVFTYASMLLRMKALAVILGPSGVGSYGYLQTVASLFIQVSNLGVNSSGVRAIAEANGKAERSRVDELVAVVIHIGVATGVAGLCVAISLSNFLSKWSFGDTSLSIDISVAGTSVLFGCISSSFIAHIQGLGRVAQMAKINIICMGLSTLISVCAYLGFGEAGIALGMAVSALVALLISWLGTHRDRARIRVPFRAAVAHSIPLFKLGIAFTWSALLASLVALATRSVIIRELGVDANGLFQAAWALSGVFAGFILGAMGTDFFPRVSAVADKLPEANQLVNQQVEIGVLLSIPGLLATCVFAPEVIRLFYSSEFAPVITLMPLFLAGIFIRVVAWPLGFLILSQKAGSTHIVVESVSGVVGLIAAIAAIKQFGLVGVGAGFFTQNTVSAALGWAVCKKMTGFRWSASIITLVAIAIGCLCAGASMHLLPQWPRWILGALVTAAAGAWIVRELCQYAGVSNVLAKKLNTGPFRWIFNSSSL